MKTLPLALLCLATLTSSFSFAQSQASSKIDAIVQFGKAKAQKVSIANASGKNQFIFTEAMSDQQLKGDVSKCSTFMIQSPTDFIAAQRLYRLGQLEAAIKRLAVVKEKYKAHLGLPGNPSALAARYELLAAIRLQDWAMVKKLAASYPGISYLDSQEKALVQVAGILGADNQAEQVAAIDAIFADKDAIAALDMESYGLHRLAQARALEASLPQAELTSTLSAESAATASKIVDYYCQAAMAQRGDNAEIMRAAMISAAKLLWAMPEVQKYQAKLGSAVTCNGETWKASPINFKDAVVLSQLATGVYPHAAADALITKISKYYYNDAKESAE